MLTANPPDGEAFYTEKKFTLRRVTLRLRDGTTQERILTIHPGSVIILPLTADGEVVLIQNRRWQLGQRLMELPAGTMDHGEDPDRCAARELEEETGYRAERIERLQSFFALPGGSTEVMHVYVARGLTAVGQKLELDEDIEVISLPMDALRRRAAAGEIHDMKTLAVLGAWWARPA